MKSFGQFVRVEKPAAVIEEEAAKLPKFGQDWARHAGNSSVEHHQTQAEKHRDLEHKFGAQHDKAVNAGNNDKATETANKANAHMTWAHAHDEMAAFYGRKAKPEFKLKDID